MQKSEKIRVMHLNPYVGYDGPSRGIIGQIKYMNKDRFQPVICEIKSTRHPELIREIEDMGCEHISLNRNKSYDLSIILKLAVLLKRNKIDILNTHNAIACWYGNIAAKIANIPVVFTLRNNQRENYKLLLKKRYQSQIAIMLDRFTMRLADKIVAVSQRLEKFYIENEGIPKEKIITINNAIDLETIEQFKKNYDRQTFRTGMGIGGDVTVIGIVGDLVKRKGHDCMIEAARIILKKNDKVVFLIVGEGPLKGDLIKKINDYCISDNFIFTGHVKNVFHHLAAMDIFVLPSFAEGISRALMESMAMGISAVCSDIDGNLEAVVAGETGFIFPVNDYQMLVDKLLFLIRDEELRKEIGGRARARVKEKFDIRNLTRKYEELYTELIK